MAMVRAPRDDFPSRPASRNRVRGRAGEQIDPRTWIDIEILDIKILDGKMCGVATKRTGLHPDSSGTHLWLVMMKAHRALARHAHLSIECLDMCFSDFAILELLLHRGAQPVNQIGRRIDLSSGAITSAVDRLERRGLVTRASDVSDRRTRMVSLTTEGRARIAEVFAEHKAAMDRAALSLSKDERQTLIRLMKKLGTDAEHQLLVESAHTSNSD
jgi:MarR family transcriptional regulator, 2-MHQ and catechol-resistance regulon repressor